MKHCLFLLVGGLQKDVERSKAECKARSLENVHFTGFVSHHRIPTYLFAGDVLILPNSANHPLSETTSPLKLFEYMASKRPIVASALGNISSVLQHKKNALLAKPDDPQSFITGIKYLFEHPSVATALADRAYEKVQYFDWDERAKRILEFIRIRQQSTVGCGFRLKKVLSELVKIIRLSLITKKTSMEIRFLTSLLNGKIVTYTW
jgi:glycosyltransferase involved in cell wall biosynthesis